jgi:hypothetical protein
LILDEQNHATKQDRAIFQVFVVGIASIPRHGMTTQMPFSPKFVFSSISRLEFCSFFFREKRVHHVIQ